MLYFSIYLLTPKSGEYHQAMYPSWYNKIPIMHYAVRGEFLFLFIKPIFKSYF